MRRILSTLTMLMLISTAAAAKPFAPCAPLSPAATEMLQTTGWNPCQGIPEEEAVGVPAYPDALVSSISVEGFRHPSLTLLSPDPAAKVQAFYQKALTPQQGWKWNGTLKVFYRGDSLMNALTGQAPAVQIFDVSGEGNSFFLIDPAFCARVETKLVIHYPPRAAAARP